MPSSTTGEARALGLTLGEPAGIGPETTFKAWQGRADLNLPPFALVAPVSLINDLRDRLSPEIPVEAVSDFSQASEVFARALPVFEAGLSYGGPAVVPGTPLEQTAPLVLESIRAAVELAQSNDAAAVVTNPIAKAVLYAGGLKHPGHTELLAELTGSLKRPVMMLAIEGLRVVPLTVHIPLTDVAASLSQSLIVETAETVMKALRHDFGIETPRLAVAALNPHAGEAGTMGREETDVIAPAIAELRHAGYDVSGPAPADTLFHARARARYDAALCMYHDQALIPLKTLDFDRGVNITLGLPIVRTSPDHGTALDIAGQGIASPDSLIAALKAAAGIARHRAGGK